MISPAVVIGDRASNPAVAVVAPVPPFATVTVGREVAEEMVLVESRVLLVTFCVFASPKTTVLASLNVTVLTPVNPDSDSFRRWFVPISSVPSWFTVILVARVPAFFVWNWNFEDTALPVLATIIS